MSQNNIDQPDKLTDTAHSYINDESNCKIEQAMKQMEEEKRLKRSQRKAQKLQKEQRRLYERIAEEEFKAGPRVPGLREIRQFQVKALEEMERNGELGFLDEYVLAEGKALRELHERQITAASV